MTRPLQRQPSRRRLTPAPCPGRPRGGGFTLIELVAILVVTAIIAAVAIPSMSSLSTNRTIIAGKQVLRDVSFARERAMLTGTRCWVTFNATTNAYSVLGENPASPGRAGATVLTDMATGKAYTITLNAGEFAGVDLVSATFDGGSEIGFDWLGQPLNTTEASLAAVGTVTLSSGRTVTVQVGTGTAAFN